jgi:hypothetical protein
MGRKIAISKSGAVGSFPGRRKLTAVGIGGKKGFVVS